MEINFWLVNDASILPWLHMVSRSHFLRIQNHWTFLLVSNEVVGLDYWKKVVGFVGMEELK